ncbi:MAG: peptidoglycan-binding protein [Chloroflexi bacterium]|nr:MAG: peptidoglycan-binding protein [Chloroflexota bacterium]PIE80857.1 MAG: peptidoglycan-binding protein [Chloroflexota bacterium]
MQYSKDDKLMKAMKGKQKAKREKTPAPEESKKEETAKAPAAPIEVKAEHTVVAGENLSKISEKYYGTQGLYMKIYEANKDTIGDNPNIIRVGQVLKIPK